MIPIYDTPLWKAVAFIADKIGEAKDTAYFPKTRSLIEERAIAGELCIWGRKQLDADPEWMSTRKFAVRHMPIPSEYWPISKLAPYCVVEPVMEDRNHKLQLILDVPCTQQADKGTWPKERNSYADLQVNWKQITGLLGLAGREADDAILLEPRIVEEANQLGAADSTSLSQFVSEVVMDGNGTAQAGDAPSAYPSGVRGKASDQRHATPKSRNQENAQNERNAQIFHERLTSWREWLVDLQGRLCRDLVAIALASRNCLGSDPLNWVNTCVDNYWKTHRPGFKNWAALCCDRADPESWVAPGWLVNEIPEETLRLHIQTAPLAETLDGRVFAPYTEIIRAQISLLIELRILMARTAVLDDAKIKIASEPAGKRVKPSASSVERVNEAVYAIGRRYGNEWNRKWLESTRGLYAELHATQVEHGADESLNSAQSRETDKHRERGPDKGKHLARVELEDSLISELAAIRECLGDSVFTLDELRKRFPAFKLWTLLSEIEQDELLEKEFKPKLYARTLTARKFGVGAEAIKKSRHILKRDTPSA